MMKSDTDFLNFGGGGGYVPSYDFDLFELPQFSDLFANEFGAETNFRANTPSSYVDFSLNQLLGALRTPNEQQFATRAYPESNELENLLSFFRSTQTQVPGYYDPTTGRVVGGRLPQEPTTQVIVYPSGTLPPELQGKQQPPIAESGKRGCNVFDMISGRCQPAILSPTGSARVPPSDETMTSDGKGVLGTPGSKRIGDFLSSLPEGTGIFIIGIVALIFLLLFVRK